MCVLTTARPLRTCEHTLNSFCKCTLAHVEKATVLLRSSRDSREERKPQQGEAPHVSNASCFLLCPGTAGRTCISMARRPCILSTTGFVKQDVAPTSVSPSRVPCAIGTAQTYYSYPRLAEGDPCLERGSHRAEAMVTLSWHLLNPMFLLSAASARSNDRTPVDRTSS